VVTRRSRNFGHNRVSILFVRKSSQPAIDGKSDERLGGLRLGIDPPYCGVQFSSSGDPLRGRVESTAGLCGLRWRWLTIPDTDKHTTWRLLRMDSLSSAENPSGKESLISQGMKISSGSGLFRKTAKPWCGSVQGGEPAGNGQDTARAEVEWSPSFLFVSEGVRVMGIRAWGQ